VVVAGIRNALHQVDRRFEEERFVFFGAGASGAGSALAVLSELARSGASESRIHPRVMCLDSQGLIVSDRPGLESPKRELAVDPARVAGWRLAPGARIGLAKVVRHFHPTVLIGASGQSGAFSESIVREMLRGCDRPIILPLSNPASCAEAVPEDLVRWSSGAALVGTGSPFPPVHFGGETFHIGQGNNALIFPGVGLGATAIHARWLPDEAFAAASRALEEYSAPIHKRGAAFYPPIGRLREVSRAVARAVARALVAFEAAPGMSEAEIDERIDGATWEPRYLPYRAG